MKIRIQEKISLLGTSIPTEQLGWKGSYKIVIDKYIVYTLFQKITININGKKLMATFGTPSIIRIFVPKK